MKRTKREPRIPGLRRPLVAALFLALAFSAALPGAAGQEGAKAPGPETGKARGQETEPLQAPKWININEFRGGVNLRWFRVQGAVQYLIQRRTGEVGNFQDLSRVSNPVFDDFMVKPGEIYFYRIVPYGREGERGPESVVRFFRTPLPEPTILEPPTWTAHQIRQDGIALAWLHEDYEHVLAYNLYRKGPGESTFSLIISSLDTNFLDRNVTRGQTYRYVITSLDKKLQESDNSSVLTVSFTEETRISLRNTRLAGIKTLEEVVGRTELVRSFSWEHYGFVSLVDVAYLAAEQRLYVSDTGTGLITVIGSNGEVLQRLGGLGDSPWEFERLLGMAVDADGFVYAVDAYKGEIVVFTPRGTFDRRIRLLAEVRAFFGPDLTSRFPWFRFGLVDISVGPDGLLYVVDNPNGWIYILDNKDKLVNIIGEKGYESGFLHYPTFLTFDWKRRIIVSDTMNSRIQLLDNTGAPLGIVGEKGMGIGQFVRPKGVAMDRSGFLYVADSRLNVIQVFNTQGDFIALLGDEKGLPIDLGSPNGLIHVPPDLLIVCERLGRRVQIRRVILDSRILFFSQKEGVTAGSPRIADVPRGQEPMVRPSQYYTALMERIRYVAEEGGSIEVREVLFIPESSEVADGAMPVLREIARSAERDDRRFSVRVLATTKGTTEVSLPLAKDRIAVLREIVSREASIRFYPLEDSPDENLSDWIEITVEKVQ